jgi:hypothetical protein
MPHFYLEQQIFLDTNDVALTFTSCIKSLVRTIKILCYTMQHFFAPVILKFRVDESFYFTAPGLRVKFIDLVLLEYVFTIFRCNERRTKFIAENCAIQPVRTCLTNLNSLSIWIKERACGCWLRHEHIVLCTFPQHSNQFGPFLSSLGAGGRAPENN